MQKTMCNIQLILCNWWINKNLAKFRLVVGAAHRLKQIMKGFQRVACLCQHIHMRPFFCFFPITLCCFLLLNCDPHDELSVPFPSDLRLLLLVLSMSVHFLVSCSSCLRLDLTQEMALICHENTRNGALHSTLFTRLSFCVITIMASLAAENPENMLSYHGWMQMRLGQVVGMWNLSPPTRDVGGTA